MKLLDQNQPFSKQRNTRNKTRSKRFITSEASSLLSVIQSFSIQQQLCTISTWVWEVFLAFTASWEGAHRVTFHVALLHQRSAPSTNLHALSISQPAIQTSTKIKGKTERMYPYLWILFSSNYSYCYEFLFLCLGDCLHVCSPQWGWQNTARDCLESLWDLHPWMPSKPDWARSSSTPLTLRLALSWASLVTRDGPDDLQSSLLTYIMIHWYYN